MKKSLLYPLIIVFVLLLSAAFFLIYQTRLFTSRASLTISNFSVDNSYVFATPLQAQANGTEQIRLTIFVLNDQGLGVLGRNVEIGKTENLQIQTISNTTDQQGKAIFDISSNSPGQYYIEVKVDDKILPQKVQIIFN